MKPRCSIQLVKLVRRVAICLTIAATAMAGWSARAADQTASQPSASSSQGDPFARYDRALNAAASQTLHQVDVSEQAAPIERAERPPKRIETQMQVAGHNLKLARQRVERLLPVIAPILRKAGVPVQLAAVVLVESGGDPTALSPKGARGLWQLMPATAREYGLIVNAETDQRLDVVQSTRAAAEYLRDLYAEFGNWKLALAAYNAGGQAVHRAMARTGGGAFATASRALPEETQNYVPAVLHALLWFNGSVLSLPANWSGAQQVANAVSH